MIIDHFKLAGLNPCPGRWQNFLKHYSGFSGSFDDFIDLENISYEDKIWVAKKVLSRNQLVHFGLLCAESVLHIYEARYPSNKAPRDLVEFMKTISDFGSLSDPAKKILQEKRRAAYAADAAAREDQWAHNLTLLKMGASL